MRHETTTCLITSVLNWTLERKSPLWDIQDAANQLFSSCFRDFMNLQKDKFWLMVWTSKTTIFITWEVALELLVKSLSYLMVVSSTISFTTWIMLLMTIWSTRPKKPTHCLSSKVRKNWFQKNKKRETKLMKPKPPTMKPVSTRASVSRVHIFQEAKNKEWLSQGLFSEIPPYCFWTRPHQPWTVPIKRKFKLLWMRSWRAGQRYQLHIELTR